MRWPHISVHRRPVYDADGKTIAAKSDGTSCAWNRFILGRYRDGDSKTLNLLEWVMKVYRSYCNTNIVELVGKLVAMFLDSSFHIFSRFTLNCERTSSVSCTNTRLTNTSELFSSVKQTIEACCYRNEDVCFELLNFDFGCE